MPESNERRRSERRVNGRLRIAFEYWRKKVSAAFVFSSAERSIFWSDDDTDLFRDSFMSGMEASKGHPTDRELEVADQVPDQDDE